MKSIVGTFLPIQKSTRSLDYIYVNTVSNTSKLRRTWIDIVRSVQCTVLRVGCTFHFSMYRSRDLPRWESLNVRSGWE